MTKPHDENNAQPPSAARRCSARRAGNHTDLLTEVVGLWKARAARYFSLAEKETDPVGKKFYEASALALTNCSDDIENLSKD